jgi:DNA-binding GntR family transcriptional regulator
MPRRGFQVAEIRARDIEDVFTLHAFLAGIMAERAAAVIPAATLVSIANLQEQIAKVSRLRIAHREKAARVEELNYAFHRAINLSVDAPRLRWFLRSTSRYVPRRFYETVPGWVATTVDDHPGILKALENRNGVLARRLMEEHVLRGGRHVIDQFKQQLSAPGR